jgi:phosphatidylglycerophosphate synthase
MIIAIIAREAIITAIRIYLLPSKVVVPASNFGKAKTVLQSIAIVFALLKLPFSWHVMLAAVLLTLISGLEYIIRIRILTGNRIVNLPNIITLSRFLLIIPFIYYLSSSRISISLLIFAVITLSDKLDGVSARLMNQKTELGSWFDSLTDYTLIISALIILFSKNYLNIFWIISFLIASTLIWLMKLIYHRRLKKVPVSFIARANVTFYRICLNVTGSSQRNVWRHTFKIDGHSFGAVEGQNSAYQ